MAKYLDNTGLRTLWSKIKDYVDNKAVSVDDALSATSENPVQNKVIYAALENTGTTVDSELSSTSENPVQNKVIYATIGNVESVLATLNSGAGV